MSINETLQNRSDSKCELCSATDSLDTHIVVPKTGEKAEDCALLCPTCTGQIKDPSTINANHWRCLSDSIWSPEPAVQVLAWRLLDNLKGENWASNLLEMLYLDDDTAEWANSEGISGIKHVDSNGVELKGGDSIVLIKDLNVKGANFIAKRGTAVRRITLVRDNPDQVEGKINGQNIVILTKFAKKSK